jgi:Fe-Mn family superoxide dismutase
MTDVLAKLREGLEPIKKLGFESKKLLEAVVLTIKTFPGLKTEKLSNTTKEVHMGLYRQYVENVNKISSKLDSVSKVDAENPGNSDFRRLKLDEQFNLNGAKLHELYFKNISDLNSEIRMDSIAFMRLARDWGSLDNWQFDFRACAMAAMEGWAILCFDPLKQKYMNVVVEGHGAGFPIGAIPILVFDTWHHAWFKDYPDDKMGYIDNMMREINWQVVEARMVAAESSNITQIFTIEPVVATINVQIATASNQPPITPSGV